MKEKNSQNVDSFNPMLIKNNLDNWVEAINGGNINKLTALYHEQATFLPTISGELKIGRKGAETYFEKFLEKKPVCSLVKNKVQPISETAYIQSGFYQFLLFNNNIQQRLNARFTFVWDEGKIIHHHSSLLPL